MCLSIYIYSIFLNFFFIWRYFVSVKTQVKKTQMIKALFYLVAMKKNYLMQLIVACNMNDEKPVDFYCPQILFKKTQIMQGS
jgi:hypothetical protein